MAVAHKLYLRPIGMLYGATGAAAIAEGLALPLAGGPIAYAAAELIEGGPGRTKRRLLSGSELAGSKDADLAQVVSRTTAPRAPFAGLGLDRPLIMGIVNVTPDSFSDGGLHNTAEGAIVRGAELAASGADIVDVGGESTRPGCDAVSDSDELSRILPVLEGLSGLNAVISIDTRKSGVARAAAKKGAKIFNDVSALTYDGDSLTAAVETGLSVVLMHAKGEPRTMQDNPATAAGIERTRIAADPGIGFGKTMAHNLALLANLSLLHGLGVPLLVGASRKRFIRGISGGKSARAREPGSEAVAIAAAAQGVQILRVHGVSGSRQALEVWRASVTGAGA